MSKKKEQELKKAMEQQHQAEIESITNIDKQILSTFVAKKRTIEDIIYRFYGINAEQGVIQNRQKPLEKKIIMEIDKQLDSLLVNYKKDLQNNLSAVYTRGYYNTHFNLDKFVGQHLQMHTINAKALNLTLSKPWANDNIIFTDRADKDIAELKKEITQKVRRGFIAGEPVYKLAQEVSLRSDVAFSKAKRIIHCEAQHFSNEAKFETYEETEVKYYQFISALDKRTTEACQDLDNEVFKLTEKVEGINYPPITTPFHACRSTTVPYFKDGIEGYGLRSARDKNGKSILVSDKINYAQWKKQFVK